MLTFAKAMPTRHKPTAVKAASLLARFWGSFYTPRPRVFVVIQLAMLTLDARVIAHGGAGNKANSPAPIGR